MPYYYPLRSPNIYLVPFGVLAQLQNRVSGNYLLAKCTEHYSGRCLQKGSEIPGSEGNHYFKSPVGLTSMLSAVLPDSLHKLQLFACASAAVSFKSNEGHGLKCCLYPSGCVPGPRWCLCTLPRGGCPLRVLFPTDGRGLIIRGNLAAQNTLGVPKAFSLFESQGKEGTLPR